MSTTEYTVDYFIQKFEKIPEGLWHVGSYTNLDRTRFCALGHCGVMKGGELLLSASGRALADLISCHLRCGVGNINDGLHKHFQQPTPKQRILAALYDIKAKQTPPAVQKQAVEHECAHLWLACGVCMICSATKQPTAVNSAD